MPRVDKDKPKFYAYCPYCTYQGFSHESQTDANRVVNNHKQRCEKNPSNDPDAIR